MDVTWAAILIVVAGVLILALAIRGVWRWAANERASATTAVPAGIVVVEETHDHDHHGHPHDSGAGGHAG